MYNNSENIAPEVIKCILKELNDIKNEPLEGIQLVLNEQDICDIQAFIDPPAWSPYEGICFRIKLASWKDYPSEPPKCFFLTYIYHPNVATDGSLSAKALKKVWNPEGGIKDVLETIKFLLIFPDTESISNDEAGKLVLEHPTEYCETVKLKTAAHQRDAQREKSSISDLFWGFLLKKKTD